LDAETVSHRVREALAMVGIEHLKERVPHHLSGGEKKRVAIAGVIAMEPQVIVLDEPTAGLDPKGVKDLISVINALAREYGITVIFSTHDVSLVPEVADYIYVMHRGNFVAQGSVSTVFADLELLSSVRLDVPVIPKLIRQLREEGLDIGMAYTLDEAKTAFLKSYRERA
ncbi:MAG: ATP-binding cassette domain-containing protein, partial [Methanoregulaceae archaeon]|nr:ATP-binding cassette domain-containing protein [Methanoregulaceae archaeon]